MAVPLPGPPRRKITIYGWSTRLLHDACGLRSVYHLMSAQPLVASHVGLLARAIDAQPSAVAALGRMGVRLGYGFPGRTTPFDGVAMLIPNCLLDLTTGDVKRYFPRASAPRTTDVGEVAARVIADVQRQLGALTARYPRVVASLTAGGDSRCTLALARPFIESLQLFTYLRSYVPADAPDASVASWMAKRLGLRHELIEVPAEPDDPDEWAAFDAALTTNGYLRHGRGFAY